MHVMRLVTNIGSSDNYENAVKMALRKEFEVNKKLVINTMSETFLDYQILYNNLEVLDINEDLLKLWAFKRSTLASKAYMNLFMYDIVSKENPEQVPVKEPVERPASSDFETSNEDQSESSDNNTLDLYDVISLSSSDFV